MKILLTLFVLLFSSSVLAEDISDFEIDGISIGQSLLDFYDINQLNNFRPINYPSSDTYIGKEIPENLYKNSSTNYDFISFHYKKNDKKFKIVSLKGLKDYDDNLQDCLKEKKVVTKQIRENFSFNNEENYESDYGKSYGSSIAYISDFILNNGRIRIFCAKFDKKNNKAKFWKDTFNVSISMNVYLKWLNDEAYK